MLIWNKFLKLISFRSKCIALLFSTIMSFARDILPDNRKCASAAILPDKDCILFVRTFSEPLEAWEIMLWEGETFSEPLEPWEIYIWDILKEILWNLASGTGLGQHSQWHGPYLQRVHMPVPWEEAMGRFCNFLLYEICVCFETLPVPF